MKIQCQSCQAKYTIADEKVLGKVVKIRCKKCSATIVINGNEQRQPEDQAGAFDYAGQGAGEPWTVNVADGDQRTMTPEEIAAEFRVGTINEETYCWKDGMADWLPLREVESLWAMIGGGAPVEEAAPQSLPSPSMDAGTGGGLFSSPPAEGPTDSPFSGASHSNGNGAGALFGGGAAEAAQAAPAAARRAGARGAGQDLFGNVEKAGGEDDVMTSAATGGLGGGGDVGGVTAPEKLTGQRNESSVLFSLSALTSDAGTKKPEENRTTASSDGSGLIDIRALSANMGSDGGEKKDTNARVDDIMNLSGGGAFGTALAAPILAPPPLETADLSALAAGGAPAKQNKTLIFAILGAGAFIAIAIVVAVVLTRSPDDTASSSPADSASATGDSTDNATAMNDTPPTGDTAAATGGGSDEPAPPSVGNADKPSSVHAGSKPSSHGGSHTSGGGDKAPSAAPAPAPEPAAAPAKPASFGDALAQAAGHKATSGGGGGGSTSSAPFDRGAAAASLGSINVQSCKKPGGPTGSGRVEVTFSPDGSAKSANIIEGPFPGTPVGGCIAGKFRGAHVPPFGGAPVHVKKSFTLN